MLPATKKLFEENLQFEEDNKPVNDSFLGGIRKGYYRSELSSQVAENIRNRGYWTKLNGEDGNIVSELNKKTNDEEYYKLTKDVENVYKMIEDDNIDVFSVARELLFNPVTTLKVTKDITSTSLGTGLSYVKNMFDMTRQIGDIELGNTYLEDSEDYGIPKEKLLNNEYLTEKERQSLMTKANVLASTTSAGLELGGVVPVGKILGSGIKLGIAGTKKATKELFGEIGKAGGAELGTEWAQSVVTNVGSSISKDEKINIRDTINQANKEGLLGFLGGAGMGTIAASPQIASKALTSIPIALKTTSDTWNKVKRDLDTGVKKYIFKEEISIEPKNIDELNELKPYEPKNQTFTKDINSETTDEEIEKAVQEYADLQKNLSEEGKVNFILRAYTDAKMAKEEAVKNKQESEEFIQEQTDKSNTEVTSLEQAIKKFREEGFTTNYKDRSDNLSFLAEADTKKINLLNQAFNEMNNLNSEQLIDMVSNMIDNGMFQDSLVAEALQNYGKDSLQVVTLPNGNPFVTLKDKTINIKGSNFGSRYFNSGQMNYSGISPAGIKTSLKRIINSSGNGKARVDAIRNALNTFNIPIQKVEQLGEIYEGFNVLKDTELSSEQKNLVRKNTTDKLLNFIGLNRQQTIGLNNQNLFTTIRENIKSINNELGLSDAGIDLFAHNIAGNLRGYYKPSGKVSKPKQKQLSKEIKPRTKPIIKPKEEPKNIKQVNKEIETNQEDISINNIEEQRILDIVYRGKKVSNEVKNNFINNFKKLKDEFIFKYNKYYVRIYNKEGKESYINALTGYAIKDGTVGISIYENNLKDNSNVYIYESYKDLIMGSNREGLHISTNGSGNTKNLATTLNKVLFTTILKKVNTNSIRFQAQKDNAYYQSIKSIDTKALVQSITGKNSRNVSVSVDVWNGIKPYQSTQEAMENISIEAYGINLEKIESEMIEVGSVKQTIKDLINMGEPNKNINEKQAIINKLLDYVNNSSLQTSKDNNYSTKDYIVRIIKTSIKNDNLTDRQISFLNRVLEYDVSIDMAIRDNLIIDSYFNLSEQEIKEMTDEEVVEIYENDVTNRLREAEYDESIITLFLSLQKRALGTINNKFSNQRYIESIRDKEVANINIDSEFAFYNDGEINNISITKKDNLSKYLDINNSVRITTLFHEFSHLVRKQLDNKEIAEFLKIIKKTLPDLNAEVYLKQSDKINEYNQKGIDNLNLQELDEYTKLLQSSSKSVDVSTNIEEAFAMALTAYILNTDKFTNNSSKLSRDKLIKTSLSSKGNIDVDSVFNKINAILKNIFNAILNYIHSSIDTLRNYRKSKESPSKLKRELLKRGEYNKEFIEATTNNVMFTNFIEKVFGVYDSTVVEQRLSKVKNNTIADIFDNLQNYTQDLYSAVDNINDSTPESYVQGLKNYKREDIKKPKDADSLGEIFTEEYINMHMEYIFKKVQTNPAYIKIQDIITPILESNFVKKMKVDIGYESIKDKFYNRLDSILDKNLKNYQRDSNEMSNNYKIIFQELTKGMTTEEKNLITQVIGYTELNNLDIREFGFLDISNITELQAYKNAFKSIFKNEIVNKALEQYTDELATYMITGNNIAGRSLYLSSEQIANRIEKLNNRKLTNDEIKLIEKYITYKALNNLSEKQKSFFANQIKNNKENFISMYSHIKSLKDIYKNSLIKSGELNNYVYGDMRNPYNSKQKIYVYKEETYRQREADNVPMKLLMKVNGVDNEGNNIISYIVSERDLSHKYKDGAVVQVTSEFGSQRSKYFYGKEASIPVRDIGGNIIGYNMMLNKDLSILEAGMVEDIVDVIGSYSLHTYKYAVRDSINKEIYYSLTADLDNPDFVLSQDNMPIMITLNEKSIGYSLPKNRKLLKNELIKALVETKIDSMTEQYIKENGKEPTQDIITEFRKEAYKLSNEYDLLPYQFSLPNGLEDVKLIRKGYQDIMLGYREFMLFNGQNRYVRLAEIMLKELVNVFKQNVIFKSIPTIVNNIMFNTILTLSNIPLDRKFLSNAKYLIDEVKNSAKEISKYGVLMRERIQLELKKESLAQIEQELSSKENIRLNKLIDETDNHSLKYFYDNGFIQSIADDIITENAENTFIGSNFIKIHQKAVDKINNTFGTNITYEGSMNKLKTIYLTPDTKYGKTLSNTVKYSDYVFRIALYNFNVNRLKIDPKIAKQTALESFVDYRKTLPFEINLLQEYGLAPFAAWLIRMQSALVRTANRNPITFLLLYISTFTPNLPFRTESWNPLNSFLFNSIDGINPMESAIAGLDSNIVVPVVYEDLYNGITNPEKLTRVFGITLQ